MESKKSKWSLIILVVVLAVSLFVTVVLAICLAQHIQLEKKNKENQLYWEEVYYRQNVAFGLPHSRQYQPYTMLRDNYGEVTVFLHICYYNYQTGSDLDMKEVFDYLACYYQAWPVTRTPQIDYNNFPRIKKFVEFMYPEFVGGSMNIFSYYDFYDEYRERLRAIQEKHPEFSAYTDYYAPLELIEEIAHSIFDPNYEMDLEISDYRYYRFLTPDTYQTGRANQEIYEEE